jgi:uncharacterized protein
MDKLALHEPNEAALPPPAAAPGAVRSCLYRGAVVHRRLKPFGHRFRYRVFWLYLDIDEIPDLARRLPGFSHNRFNLTAFYDRDHGPGDGRPLRPWLEQRLRAAGIEAPLGSVSLLCFPRLFGFVFNPLSVWYCFERAGRPLAILYEVSNTFGERHGYLIPWTAEPGVASVSQACSKRFFVSPFFPATGRYRFALTLPEGAMSLSIMYDTVDGTALCAWQRGRRENLSAVSLAKAVLLYPLMTIKVIAAIHWHALRLWLKGARLQTRPPAPADSITVTHAAPAASLAERT